MLAVWRPLGPRHRVPAVNGSDRQMMTPGFQSAFRPLADCANDLKQNTVDLQDVQYLEIMTHLCFPLLILADLRGTNNISQNRDAQHSTQLALAAVQAGKAKRPPSHHPPSTGDVWRLFLPSLAVQLNDSCLKSVWIFHLSLFHLPN